MGRLVAQGLHLVDQAQFMGLRVNGVAADLAHRVFLVRSVFVDHEQPAHVLGKGQP
ncbi:hypothetical protein D3C72_2520350 [compost metagenome]